jgi:hypothetical protein
MSFLLNIIPLFVLNHFFILIIYGFNIFKDYLYLFLIKMNIVKYDNEFIINFKNNHIFINEVFDNFLIKYNKIVINNSSIPIFNSTSKYTVKNKKNYKKKYSTQAIFIRNCNAWVPNSNIGGDKEIIHTIQSNLNKISSTNFKKITKILLENLRHTTNSDIIDILCVQLLNKNLYDKDYQDEYVKLSIIISRENFSNNINIYKYNSELYWKYKEKYIGPFNSIESVNNYFKTFLSFKNILMNKLYHIFINKEQTFKSILLEGNEEVKFKKKRKILSIVEFISKLYKNNLINFNLIFIIHLNLINLNRTIDIINFDIELLYNIWQIIRNVNNSSFNINLVNFIYNFFIFKLKFLNTSYRINFFIDDIICIIQNKFTNLTKDISIIQDYSSLYKNCACINDQGLSDNSEQPNNSLINKNIENDLLNKNRRDDDFCYIEDEILDNIKKDNIYNFIINKKNNIDEYLDTLIYIVLNDIKIHNIVVSLLKKLIDDNIIDKYYVNTLLNHSDDDIQEMMLDNKKIKDNFIYLKNIFQQEFSG